MTTATKAHLGLLGTNIFFAINLSAVKHITTGNFVQPYGLNVIRVGVSVLLFWVLFLLKPSSASIQRSDIPRFLLCALTGIAINQTFFIKGLSFTYSIHAALLMLTTPILITFAAAWLLKERLNIFKLLGLAMGIAGALVLILNRESTGSGSDVILGDIMILINAISYTIYFILVKPLMNKYNPVHVIRWVFTLGLLMVLPFGWSEFSRINWPSFTQTEFILVALIAVGGTFLAYLFNIYGIKILGASMAGNYIYTQPFLAALIAWFFLHEPLQAYHYIAAVLIFAGVYLANKRNKK